MRRSRSAALLAVLMAFPIGLPATAAAPTVAATTVVEMRSLSYAPTKVTFGAPGGTIRWRNVTAPSRLHDAVSSLPDYFGTPLMGSGQSATFTFAAAGTFTYLCTIHDVMLGRVEVAPTVAVERTEAGSRLVITIATTRFALDSAYRSTVYLKGPGDATFRWRRTSRARVVRLPADRPGEWTVMVRVRHRPTGTLSSESPTVTVTVPG